MAWQTPSLILSRVFLALAVAGVDGYYGGRRRSSRSFVRLGRLHLGTRNDLSEGQKQNESLNRLQSGGIFDNEVRLVPSQSSSTLCLESDTSPEPAFAEETILAAVKSKHIGRFLPRLRKASSNTQLREQSAPTSPSESIGLDPASLSIGAAEPLIPQDVWEAMTGDEYDDLVVVDRLALAGLLIATKHTGNGWVEWKGSIPADLEDTLDHGGIEVFTGSALRPGYGSEVPWIKSISHLPFSPSEMIDLMMDSSRVKTYNSLSLGREDVRVIMPPPPPADALAKATKIVRNVVQLPVSNSKVESVTLLHTRKLENGARLLVSRAIGGSKYYDDKMGTGYTLLGVNLFEPITNSPDACRLTAISHVYSPGVPLMIAGKVGVKSAKNFVKDIRALCVPASG